MVCKVYLFIEVILFNFLRMIVNIVLCIWIILFKEVMVMDIRFFKIKKVN